MEKNKKLLVVCAIFIVIETVYTFLTLYFKNSLISEKKINNIVNIISLIVSIISILYYLLISRKKIDLKSHYKGILNISILVFCFSSLISGIIGFAVYNSLEKPKKKKRELPVIEYQNFTNKYICLFLFIVCLYLMMIPKVEKVSDMILIYVLIMLIMVLIFRKQLLHDFKIFKEYFKEYMSLTLKTWLKSLIVMAILSLSIQIITGTENSNNQQNLQEMFNKIPILISLLTVIYAPIVEELMFRGVFRKFLKNKYIFIIISGVTFGLMHVIDDSKTLAELSYVIVYSSLGIYLASLYYKTNNLFTNISFHFLQNLLGVVGMLLLKFFI